MGVGSTESGIGVVVNGAVEGPHPGVGSSAADRSIWLRRFRRWSPWAALGAAGASLRLFDQGGTAARAAVVLLGVAVIWALALAVLSVLGAPPVGVVLILAILSVASIVFTRPFLGRDSLLVGVAGVMVLDATFRRKRPSLPWLPRGSGVSLPALMVLVLAQYRWVSGWTLPGVVGLLLVAYTLALMPLPALFAPSAAEWARVRSASATAWPRLKAIAGTSAARTFTIATALGLVWAPVYWRLVNASPTINVFGINDYPLHLEVARDFSLVPFRTNAPHFLFHAATAAWDLIVSSAIAPILTLSSATALSYVAVVVLFRQPSRGGVQLSAAGARVLALGYFMIETPALLALYWGAIPSTSPIYTVHWWPNPTWLVALPFMFFTLPLIERVIDGAGGGRDERAPWLLGIVTVLGAIAKPGLALCLVPALPVYLVLVRKAGALALRRAVTWCVVPGAAVIVWQTWFLGLSSASQFSSGWTIDPVVDAPFGWSNVGVMFFMPFVPVLLALGVGRGAFLRERSVQLVLLCTTFALPLMLFVRETDERAQHGNLAVPMQACMTLLVALAIRFLGQHAVSSWRRHRAEGVPLPTSTVISAVAGCFFLAGGVLSLLDGVGLIHVPVDWLQLI
jgi:hypothetical protein